MKKSFRENLKESFITSAGWLFADLLLALGMLFMAANTVAIRPPTPTPPTLTVNPTSLNPTDQQHCTGGISNPRCTVTVEETASSQGNVDWTASSDMSDAVKFNPPKGTLSPGKSVSVTMTISAFPCQDGFLTFSGSRGASPVAVLWRCTLIPNDRILEHGYCRIKLDVGNPSVFINDDVKSARSIVEPQLNQQQFLKDRRVGIAIAYGGANDGGQDRGTQVANQVYNVLKSIAADKRAQTYSVFNPSSLYESLFTGFEAPNTAIINVYLVERSDHPGETCDAKTHVPV